MTLRYVIGVNAYGVDEQLSVLAKYDRSEAEIEHHNALSAAEAIASPINPAIERLILGEVVPNLREISAEAFFNGGSEVFLSTAVRNVYVVSDDTFYWMMEIDPGFVCIAVKNGKIYWSAVTEAAFGERTMSSEEEDVATGWSSDLVEKYEMGNFVEHDSPWPFYDLWYDIWDAFICDSQFEPQDWRPATQTEIELQSRGSEALDAASAEYYAGLQQLSQEERNKFIQKRRDEVRANGLFWNLDWREFGAPELRTGKYD